MSDTDGLNRTADPQATTPRPGNLMKAQQCEATSKGTGERCKRRAILGAKTCRVHGSATARARAAAARNVADHQAARAAAILGVPIDISPAEALLEEVRRTAGHVQWLREQVVDAHGEDPDTLVWGATLERDKTGGDDHGHTIEEKAEPSVWYRLYCDERDRLVRVCSAALKAGVEERRVALAERQGALIADVIRRILADLHLTDEQTARVPEVVPRHLRLLSGGAA